MRYLAGVILFGILISAWPHFVQLAHSGSLVWFADTDELDLYLMTASQAFFNHVLTLSDPLFASVKPTVYPILQLTPGVLAAKLSGLGPVSIGFFWRVFAGAATAAAWYWLYLVLLKNRFAAASLTIVSLADAGVFYVKPIYYQFLNIVHPDPELVSPGLLAQHRIISPGLSLYALLLYLTLLYRARTSNKGRDAGFATAGFALLFYVYFYYWTAALCSLALCWLADRPARALYRRVALGGFALGLPKILYDLNLQHSSFPGWSQRSDKFLPIGHFDELIFNKGAFVLLLACGYWAWKKRHDLKPLVLHGAATLVVMNHQLITGLQIENFHWAYMSRPLIYSLVFVVAADFGRGRVSLPRPVLAAAVAAMAVTGLYLRNYECFKTRFPLELADAHRRYTEQRNAGPVPAANLIVAGDAYFVSFSSFLDNQRPLAGYSAVLSPNISNDEWNERAALDGFLEGLTRQEFQARQLNQALANPGWGPWGHHKEIQSEMVDLRMNLFDRIAAEPSAWIKKYSVARIGIRTDRFLPPSITAKARVLQAGPYWRVFDVTAP